MKVEREGDKENSQNFGGKPDWEMKLREIEKWVLKLSVGGNSAGLYAVVDIRIRLFDGNRCANTNA